MPWTKKNVPEQAKVLPADALKVWIEIANSGLETYKGDEAKAIATAWAALKKQGWHKDADGEWVKTEKSSDDAHTETFADDADKKAQETRAKKYGIAVKDGGHVTKPSEWADVPDSEFLDPVNYRYPVPDADQTRTAASYWGKEKNKTQYNSKEQGIMDKRLDAARKKFKIGDTAQKARDDTPAGMFAEVEKNIREKFKSWGPVLKSVVLLGADAPAVKTLADVEARGEPGELRDVEIFAVGTHGDAAGRHHTLAELEQIVANFHALKKWYKPPLWIYHDDEQEFLRTKSMALGEDHTHDVPAAGRIEDLKLVGERLIAPLVSGVPEIVRRLINSGAFTKLSSEIWPAFNFDDAAPTEIWSQEEKREPEGGEDSMETLTKAEHEEAVKKAVTDATLKFRDENARLKAEKDQLEADRDAAKHEVALASAQRFADEQKALGLGAFVEDLGLVKLAVSMDDTEVEKFSDAKGAKPVTQRAAFLAFVGELVKRAKAGKLFVEPGEKAPTEKFGDNAGHGEGDGEDTPEKAADRMAGHSRRVPRKEGDPKPYEL